MPNVWRSEWKTMPPPSRPTMCPSSGCSHGVVEAVAHLAGVVRTSRVRLTEDAVGIALYSHTSRCSSSARATRVAQRHFPIRDVSDFGVPSTPRDTLPATRSTSPEPHKTSFRSQRNQLALAEPSHRCRENDRAIRLTQVVIGHGMDRGVNLGRGSGDENSR